MPETETEATDAPEPKYCKVRVPGESFWAKEEPDGRLSVATQRMHPSSSTSMTEERSSEEIAEAFGAWEHCEWRVGMLDSMSGCRVLEVTELDGVTVLTLWDPLRKDNAEITLGVFRTFSPRPCTDDRATIGVLEGWVLELGGDYTKTKHKENHPAGWMVQIATRHFFPHSTPSYGAALLLAIQHGVEAAKP